MFDQIETGRLGKADDGCLGGAVDSDQRFAAPSGLTCHVDDLAASAASNHRSSRRLQGEQGAGKIDGHESVKTVAGDFDDRREIEQGGIVDQYVDTAKTFAAFYCCVDRCLVRDVKVYGPCCRADAACGLFSVFQIDISNDHICAFACVGFRKGSANSAGRPGNQCGFTRQPLHLIVFPSEPKR